MESSQNNTNSIYQPSAVSKKLIKYSKHFIPFIYTIHESVLCNYDSVKLTKAHATYTNITTRLARENWLLSVHMLSTYTSLKTSSCSNSSLALSYIRFIVKLEADSFTLKDDGTVRKQENVVITPTKYDYLYITH